MYPNFHEEMTLKYIDEDGDTISIDSQFEWEAMLDSMMDHVIRLYVQESHFGYFKDGPLPEPIKFYVDHVTQLPVHINDTYNFVRTVPQCLSSLFHGGNIIPNHIPDFLKEAVTVKYVEQNVADIDVDIPNLFDLLHSRAIQLLGSNNLRDLEEGKELLLAILKLVPDHAVSLYNLACAESLLGNLNESIAILEKAIVNGFRDVEHMIQDQDLLNLRETEAFKFLISRILGETENHDMLVTEPIPEKLFQPIQEPIQGSQTDLSASMLPLKESFGNELEILSSMGFSADRDVMLLLLEQFQGNVDGVAQFLLAF